MEKLKLEEPGDIIKITEEIFKKGGVLFQEYGFDFRQGQYDMAITMAQSLSDKYFKDSIKEFKDFEDTRANPDATAICEAGTGTGKTLAYGVPAAVFGLLSKKMNEKLTKAVSFEDKNDIPAVGTAISVHTIALQEQFEADKHIISKLVETTTGEVPIITKLAGRANYFCIQTAQNAVGNKEIEPKVKESIQYLIEQYQEVKDDPEFKGLTSELVGNKWVSKDIYPLVGSSVDSCKSHTEDNCCYLHAKQVAKTADILIANHSLCMARSMNDQEVNLLDKFTTIFDEAHTLEHVVSDYYMKEIDIEKISTHIQNVHDKLPNSIKKNTPTPQTITKDIKSVLDKLVKVKAGTTLVDEPFTKEQKQEINKELQEIKLKFHSAFYRACQSTGLQFGKVNEQTITESILASSFSIPVSAKTSPTGKAILSLVGLLKEVDDIKSWAVDYNKDRQARWVEQRDGKNSYHSEVIDLKPFLKKFHKKANTAGMTSATLQGTKGLQTFVEANGLLSKNCYVKECCSPFDLNKQMQLVIPDNMPEPPRKGASTKFYDSELNRYIKQTVDVTRKGTNNKGGTLVLFTSFTQMKQCEEALKKASPHLTVLAQGPGKNKKKLVEAFKNNPGSVLMGVESFWTGIDIPGVALSTVILTKLPFKVPTPGTKKKEDVVKAAGGNAFLEVGVDPAIKTTKQGTGRLIRKETDKGMVVILDRRVTSKQYGKHFRKGLPPHKKVLPIIKDKEDIKI